MLRHVEPSAVDEPLLLFCEDDEDEDGDEGEDEAHATGAVDGSKKQQSGGAGGAKLSQKHSGMWGQPRKRRAGSRLNYRSGTGAVVLRQNDLLIKVMEDEEGSDEDERRGAVSVVLEYGACGLAACGHSPCWRGLANFSRVVYSYYFFNWTVIFAALGFCMTVSLVYEAWLTGTPHGQAAVVMAVLPTLNLCWLLMTFTLHILCLGVWSDFHDLEAAMQGLKRRMQSQALRTGLSLLAALLVNLPVLVSFVIFVIEIAGTAPQWMWRGQFWLSFGSNCGLAVLFFLGALVGQDHTPVPSPPPPPPPSWLPRLLARPWCWLYSVLHSDLFDSLRVYARSAFVEGGAFNEAPSMWGRHATDFIPEPVDLEDDRHLKTRYFKRWPTPWYCGWYCRDWLLACTSGSSAAPGEPGAARRRASFDRSRWFQAVVVGPWALLLVAILSLLAVLSWSVQAYLVLAIVAAYFLLLPALYSLAEATVGHNRTAEVVVDLLLLLAMVGGYVSVMSVAAFYLGGTFVPIILLANLTNLLCHLPAIRDRPCPPPRDHRQSLAFHVKAMCHTIVSSARAGAFVTILLVLSLALAMRTVPNPNSSSNSDGLRLKDPPPSSPSDVVPYAFCSSSFAGGLSVLDLAYISDAAYLTNMTDIKNTVDNKLAGDWDFTVSEVPLEAEYNRAYLPSILQLQDDKAKVLVLSTRGTDEVFDLFQDLDAWCEALVVQTAAYLFPLYGSPIFQPYMDKFVGTSSNLVEALSILKDALLNRQQRPCGTKHQRNTCRYYYDQLYDYVQSKLLSDPVLSGYRLVFTGHSLGGGVAQIVGARLRRPAVTFSAPGVVLSRRKFRISLDDINDFLLNVVPQGDLVPLIDSQGVKQQEIRCEFDKLSVQCHSLTHTIAVIEQACAATMTTAAEARRPRLQDDAHGPSH